MKISVLIISRKRPLPLLDAINSLKKLASNMDEVEIIIGMDEDDQDSIDRVKDSDLIKNLNVKFLIEKRKSYSGIHDYFNELFRLSIGQWIFCFTDDAEIRTEGWDNIIRGYGNRFLLLGVEHNNSDPKYQVPLFPIIPRRWGEALGHLTLHYALDSWLEHVAKILNVYKNVPIYVYNKDIVDETKMEGLQWKDNGITFGVMEAERQADAKILKETFGL